MSSSSDFLRKIGVLSKDSAYALSLSPEFLRSLDALPHASADKWIAAFPQGLSIYGPPATATVEKIVRSGLDLDWLCERVMDDANLDEYNNIREEVREKYASVRDEAWAKHMRFQTEDSLKEYEKTMQPSAQRAYERAVVQHVWCVLADPRNRWKPRDTE